LHSQLRNERGFTLIESLLVLFCLMIVLTVTIVSISKRGEQYEQAFEKFYMMTYEAQVLAKDKKTETEIIVRNENTVVLRYGNGEIVTSFTLPPQMTIRILTDDMKIRYTENGTISRLGNVAVITPKGRKDYSINMTYGRLREK